MKLKKIISLALTVVMSSTLLVGCGKSKKSAQVLNIYNVGDYIDEDLITKFEEETGIDVVYETYDTNEAMYQKLKSGSTKYDLIFPSDYTESSAFSPSSARFSSRSGRMQSARNSSTCAALRPVKSSGLRMASISS